MPLWRRPTPCEENACSSAARSSLRESHAEATDLSGGELNSTWPPGSNVRRLRAGKSTAGNRSGATAGTTKLSNSTPIVRGDRLPAGGGSGGPKPQAAISAQAWSSSSCLVGAGIASAVSALSGNPHQVADGGKPELKAEVGRHCSSIGCRDWSGEYVPGSGSHEPTKPTRTTDCILPYLSPVLVVREAELSVTDGAWLVGRGAACRARGVLAPRGFGGRGRGG